jgi:hypothetical protein
MRTTSHPVRSGRKLAGPSGLATSYDHGVVAVVESSTSPVVVVASAVLVAVIVVVAVAVVVDARSRLPSLDGVPGITVGPEPALDHRCCCPGHFFMVLMPGGGCVRTMRGWRCPSSAFRPLA